jgi:S1-C subfamily serine protease
VHAGASLAGLNSGDVIYEVDGARVRNLSDFCREVRRWTSSGRPGVQLTVQSQGTGTPTEINVTRVSR